MEQPKSNKLAGALGWKLLERFGVQGTQFVLQIILARILDPAHYGVLSIMIIFVNLANVFIQTGFNTALVQNKEVEEEDYSSVFWVSLCIAVILYVMIFFAAPLIGKFYNIPDIVSPLRVLSLMLLPGALNSVQLAKVSREMDFRKVFYSNVAGILISGICGITIAFLGGGLWALVAQTMINVFVICVVMFFTAKLRLRFVINWKRVGILFRFGWKLLASGLLNTLYQDLRSLVIGKKYDTNVLGYYNRGKQFPQFIITAVDGAVQSVMLPAMASEQDEKAKVKSLMRNSIAISSYIIFPIMAGLAGVAMPLVSLLLTDKWLPCVPYLQIYCFTLAFYPVHSCNLQAINAMGRSDIFLKLEIIKKALGISTLVVAVFCFDTPIAIAATGAITGFISCFINAYPNKKLIGYSYMEQMKDLIPSFALSVIMLGCVLAVGFLPMHTLWILILQVIVGIAVYVAGSSLFRFQPFRTLLGLLKNLRNKRK
ncbi:MAG: lipopolysaccharide biosynthesis protein [Oscillospiraceae bacterium]|nr:lipopolysaccharide biosynthesis protein [Oscillospiraceae bacterium]